ncbi:hypothetical protein [Nitratireductor sp. XY-223]|uniref:hypothetical protein n=1 Tax=Nitratireductor sp. XY-223 TaxID=2561926 RepID=UPI0010AA48CC|nr:hypothetical protein [Nitratireductor sp. XY-223]
MLNRTHTAVFERGVEIAPEFVTEPYEVAWVDRGRWFVHVLEADPDTWLNLQTEMSPEGLTWCNHETSEGSFKAEGLISLKVEDPGPYTRLRLAVGDRTKRIKARIYLTMRQ